ncbi:MAG: hypothetical protein R3F33_15045 [Planctomycetota bacterium]
MTLRPCTSLVLGLLATSPLLAQTCDVRLTGGDINGAEKVGASLWKSGNLVFSGAPGEHVNGVSINGGAVYVHEKDTLTGAWTEIAKLEPTSLVARENFGTDLDGQGNTLVIGAPDQSPIVATTTGSVFVMSHGGNGVNWTVDQVLTPSDGAIGDQFGMSVAISGNYIIVGSPGNDETATNRGAAYVFENIGGVWTEVQKILAPAGTTGSGYGDVVEIEGDVMLIGSSFANLGGINGGLLEAYMLDGAGIWQEHQHVTGSAMNIADYYASSISFTGGVLAVGSANDDDVVNNCGSVYVFRWDALNMLFLQEARLVRTVPVPSDFLGRSVHTDGVRVIAGGDGFDPAGGAVVFEQNGGVWGVFREVMPQELGPNGGAGAAVFVDGDTSLLGDVTDSTFFFQNGATFVTNLTIPDANGNGIGDWCESLGVNYCSPNVVNSTGQSGVISAVGSSFVADNTLTLEVAQLPNFVFGIFITSQTQGLIANPGGADGNLCLSGAIGRYNQGGQIFGTSGSGTGSLVLDLTMTPTPNTPVAVMAGETWNFQAWYRDFYNNTSHSNFTDAISITFQ